VHTCVHLDDNMDIRHTAKKGKYMDTLERFHVYRITKQITQLIEAYTDIINPIFNMLM
jgi:hypothetical protein